VLLWLVIAAIILTLGYTIYQVSSVITEGYDRKARVVEIALTWLLRAAGFFIGYKLASAVFANSPRQKYAS
jgi:hypothetical protein